MTAADTEIKRIKGSIVAERMLLVDKLANARKAYIPLERTAKAATDRQMKVYREIKELEEAIAKIDEVAKQL